MPKKPTIKLVVQPRATPSKNEMITLDAISFSYNDCVMFLCVFDADQLFSIAKVSRAVEDSERGYQRLLTTSRAKDIAAYIDEGRVIPGSIVLSAQEKSSISFNPDTKQISFASVEGAFLVIDGQHRLYGAHLAKTQAKLSACIFAGLDHISEVQYFLDVNSTQRGVPRSLELEVRKFTSQPGSREDMLVKLFHEFEARPTSPLLGHLSATMSVPGKLTHVPFQNALKPLLVLPPLSDANFDQTYKLIENFLNATEQVLKPLGVASKLFNAAFFQAVFGIFREAVTSANIQHGNMKVDSIVSVLTPIASIEWQRHSGTNQQSIKELTRAMQAAIGRNTIISDSKL